MKSNYKRIGDYIQEVKDRNTNLRVNNLLGINIDKFFMPSVANIVGTDMTTYKIVKTNQFACNRMHVGRDKRLPVALLNQVEDVIVSPAYDVFEIINQEELDPEYLMLWFLRKEFDRNVWFYTDADVRGGLGWKDFCNLKLPVPSLAKQKEIVKEYNVIKDRIRINNSIVQKLEEAAQTLYKKWFIESDIKYRDITFGEIVMPRKGKTITREETNEGMYPVVAGGIEPSCYHNKFNTGKPVITISASGANAGYVNLYHSEVWASDSSFIDMTIFENIYFCFVFLKANQDKITSMQIGTGQPHIYPEQLMSLETKEYPKELIESFNNEVKPMFERIGLCLKQNTKLNEFCELLLSKLATAEDHV